MIDSDDKFSELESAIRWGCVDPLLQAGLVAMLEHTPALVSLSDEFGETLLMIAADAGNVEIVHKLCALGADSKALSLTGNTALIAVVGGARDDASGTEGIKLREDIIKLLLEYGAEPNQLGYQGCSALHYAVMYGQTELVQCLICGGADPKVQLCDPPDNLDAIALAESARFYGNEAQRQAIVRLLKNSR